MLYITLSLLVLSLSDVLLYSIYITKVKAANLSINFSILTNSSATVANGGLAIAAMHTACYSLLSLSYGFSQLPAYIQIIMIFS